MLPVRHGSRGPGLLAHSFAGPQPHPRLVLERINAFPEAWVTHL